MRCEAAEFNDVEWNVRETEKVGHWNGKSVQSLGTDQAIHQIYASSRVESSVHIRPIIGDYTPDENSVSSHSDNNSSSSSNSEKESDSKGSYEVKAFAEKDKNGKNNVGVQGGVQYGSESTKFHFGGEAKVNEDGKLSGRVEAGVKKDF